MFTTLQLASLPRIFKPSYGPDLAVYIIFFLCLTPFDARNSWFHQSSKIALTWENSKYTAKKIMANFSRSCFYWLAGKCTKCTSSILVFPSINRAVGASEGGGQGDHCPPDFGRSVNPSQGGHIMPTPLLLAPSDFQTFLRPCLITKQERWTTVQ